MLRLSKLADYGTLIMSHLALTPSQRFSASEIAKALSLPLPTVSKLLKLLSEQSLLTSCRGANGGYQLAKPAGDINLGEVIQAIEGKPALTECSLGPNICHHQNHCGLQTNWQRINYSIGLLLEKISLSDMNSDLSKHPIMDVCHD